MSQPTAISLDIIPFTTINHEAQKMLGISNDEYCVANAIHNLSHNPKSSIPGWCYAKKEYLSASVNVSRASVFRYIHKLVSLGLVELHPDRKELMRTTAKWYDSTLIKKIEVVVEDMPIVKPQSQNETNVSDSINTNSLKMRQEYQDEKSQSQIEIAIYKDLQGNLDKEKDKERNNSSYEELQQAADDVKSERVVVELVAEPKAETKSLATKKREPNPDGSYGDPEVNEVRTHFLNAQDISGEDCTKSESGRYWSLLLAYIEKEAPGINRVVALKKFIDCLVSGLYIEPSRITSSKRLYYTRHELMKRIREQKTRYSKSTTSKATYGNIVGGVAW